MPYFNFSLYWPCVCACLTSMFDSCVRWMRWCSPWSRPSPQQQPYKAARPKSSCAKPAPCMTCTSSASELKVGHVIQSQIQLLSRVSWRMVWVETDPTKFHLCCFLGLYPPRAKLAIQKYLSQLTDNEQAEIFERVQVRCKDTSCSYYLFMWVVEADATPSSVFLH